MTATSAAPRVAIIIVSWNRWTHMEGCLSALPRMTYPNVKIVVVGTAAMRSAEPSADALYLGLNRGADYRQPR